MGRMHPAPDPLALTSVAFVEAAKANGIARGVALEAYRAVHRRGEWLSWMAPLQTLHNKSLRRMAASSFRQ